jgi:hypothetical protein
MSKNLSRAPRGSQEPPCPLPREPMVQRGGVHMVTQFLLVQRSGLDLAIRVTRSALRLGEIYALRRVPLDPPPLLCAVVRPVSHRTSSTAPTTVHSASSAPSSGMSAACATASAPRAASRKLPASAVLPSTAWMPRSFSFQADSSERANPATRWPAEIRASLSSSPCTPSPRSPARPFLSSPAAPSDAGAYHGSG